MLIETYEYYLAHKAPAAEAISFYEQQLEKDHDNVSAMISLWHLHETRGDIELALHYINRILVRDPVSHPALYSAARLHFAKGDEDR